MPKYSKPEAIIGVDLGDKYSHICKLASDTGEVAERKRIVTSEAAFVAYFAEHSGCHVVVEASGQSPWVSRLLRSLGCRVTVANARQLKLIYQSNRKNDRLDAENLARLARLDPKLLAPIKHRSKQAQADLSVVRSRETLIRSRTQLVNHVRGVLKSFGIKPPKSGTASFHKKVVSLIPAELEPALSAVVECLERISEQIKALDKRIRQLCDEVYPQTALLRQVRGVGPLVALTYILTLEKPEKFAKSRSVGAYLGLTPGRKQSGDSDPQRSISKQGDSLLRHLLLQSAHHILGVFGKDSDLRRYGEAIAARGGGHAKKRALVAVARKLAVLLHCLWATGEVYEPLRNSQASA